MTTLEILRSARASIANEDWQFGNWNQCTCGHIYRAAIGGTRQSVTEGEVLENMNHPVFMEVAVSLGYSGDGLSGVGLSAGDYISQYTEYSRQFNRDSTPDREDGIVVIDRAIASLEAEYEANRLDVLAQTKDVIDNVEVELVSC